MEFNYQTICESVLLKDLPERTREVISRRFGLKGEKETLESIGQDFGITRERVRQIEEDGLSRLKEKINDLRCQNVLRYFKSYLQKSGLLQKEDVLLVGLGGNAFQNHVFFLLTLGKDFKRFGENKDFYAFWTIDGQAFNNAKNMINSFVAELRKKNQPLDLPKNISPSYIEISKNVLRGPEGLYGLRDWPEINPRGVKDKAYIIFKEQKAPLHFNQVTTLINQSNLFGAQKPVISQTVHNELIKDPRFVLVGRGLYGLREWGYTPGVVREVIWQVLSSSKKPMEKAEIVEKVLGQRQVKPNTILLNLANKDYFIKKEGKYVIRKV